MNPTHSVLIADPIHDDGKKVLAGKSALRFDVATGLDEAALISRMPGYDALIVRSKTRVTRKVIEAARNLKVIGRAGIGVDNIDVSAATEHGYCQQRGRHGTLAPSRKRIQPKRNCFV